MSNADKRHAVRMALEDEELSQHSNREIAEQCKVSEFLVRTLREEKEQGAIKSQTDQNSLKGKVSDSKSSEIERLEKELANREEYEKKREAEIEATIAERVQEELAKQSGQPNDEPPRDEELERLRQEIAGREEAERQLREEMEAFRNTLAPDMEAAIAERVACIRVKKTDKKSRFQSWSGKVTFPSLSILILLPSSLIMGLSP